mgnify:CR=1 FL=1
MQTTNPLPGMNPYLEGSWADVHTALIGFIREAVSEQLPMDLNARAEEEIEIQVDDATRNYRADVGVNELWPQGLPPLQAAIVSQGVMAVAEPEIIDVEELPHRWVEINDADGRLITVIEVLSPSNKTGVGRDTYLQRQLDLISAGVNLVEIDFLRQGQPVCRFEVAQTLRPATGTRYIVMATRALRPSRREIYYCPLREALPTIRVPLRPQDGDVALALQPLIDRVYLTGRYWQTSRRPLPAPALPAEDAKWMEETLQAAGLR